MYRFLANVYPKKLRESYRKLLVYSNIKSAPDKFIGFMLVFGLGIALAIALDLAALFKLPVWPTFIISFFIIEISVYMWLLLRADAKARFVEEVLPDALQLMASNLRAGLTTDRALLLSARPEFGPLQEEISMVGKEITMGKEIDHALLNMKERIKSDKLEKTVLLLVAGLKSGGELAALLEQTASNLRQQRFVEERIKSNVLMYVIFIFGAVGFGAPLLFGLSSFLIEVLTKTMGSVSLPETGTSSQLPLTIGKVTIDPGFIMIFSLVSLITTAILGSLILGLISKGKEKEGVKFMPILIAVTLGVFFIVRFLISRLFGGMFGI